MMKAAKEKSDQRRLSSTEIRCWARQLSSLTESCHCSCIGGSVEPPSNVEDDVEYFFNSEADSLEQLIAGVSQRSVACSFVLLGKEIGVLYREIKMDETHAEHRLLQLIPYQRHFETATWEYTELKEQL